MEINNFILLEKEGDQLLDQQNYIQALEKFLVCEKQNSEEDINLLAKISFCYKQCGDLDQAFIFGQKALQQNQTDLDLLMNLSEIESERKDYESARTYLEKVQKQDEKNQKCLFQKAILDIKRNNFDQGEIQLIDLLKQKDLDEKILQLSLYQLGQLQHLNLDKKEEALKNYKLLVKKFPKNENAYFRLYELEQGDEIKLKWINQLLDESKYHLKGLYLKSSLLQKKGDLESALKEIKKIDQSEKNKVNVIYQEYKNMGAIQEAILLIQLQQLEKAQEKLNQIIRSQIEFGRLDQNGQDEDNENEVLNEIKCFEGFELYNKQIKTQYKLVKAFREFKENKNQDTDQEISKLKKILRVTESIFLGFLLRANLNFSLNEKSDFGLQDLERAKKILKLCEIKIFLSEEFLIFVTENIEKIIEWEDKFSQIRNHLNSFDKNSEEAIYLDQVYKEESRQLKINKQIFFNQINNFNQNLNPFPKLEEIQIQSILHLTKQFMAENLGDQYHGYLSQNECFQEIIQEKGLVQTYFEFFVEQFRSTYQICQDLHEQIKKKDNYIFKTQQFLENFPKLKEIKFENAPFIQRNQILKHIQNVLYYAGSEDTFVLSAKFLASSIVNRKQFILKFSTEEYIQDIYKINQNQYPQIQSMKEFVSFLASNHAKKFIQQQILEGKIFLIGDQKKRANLLLQEIENIVSQDIKIALDSEQIIPIQINEEIIPTIQIQQIENYIETQIQTEESFCQCAVF